MVFITRSACHWYYARVGDCKPSLAVLVTGTTSRFLLNSTVEHVLRPLTHGNKRYKVDYYVLLTETRGQAYRHDLEYMNHVVGDPLFHGTSLAIVTRNVTGESGATLKKFLGLPEALPVDQNLLGEGSELDVRRFPTFDSRNPNRTVAGNRNMVKLFNHQQYLWDTELRKVEKSQGEYDYIMLIRDDTLWLADFNLTKLLESNPGTTMEQRPFPRFQAPQNSRKRPLSSVSEK